MDLNLFLFFLLSSGDAHDLYYLMFFTVLLLATVFTIGVSFFFSGVLVVVLGTALLFDAHRTSISGFGWGIFAMRGWGWDWDCIYIVFEREFYGTFGLLMNAVSFSHVMTLLDLSF